LLGNSDLVQSAMKRPNAGNSSLMNLLRRGLVWIVCGAAACAQAFADDVAAQQPQPPPTSRPKAKAPKSVKVAPSQADGLGAVKFSNPYAPPEGAGKATGGDFSAARTAAPVDPKGGVSVTYKWHATNEPVDPYWHVRDPGPDAPGSSFLGGLKLGF
jgi:hypothetical protein